MPTLPLIHRSCRRAAAAVAISGGVSFLGCASVTAARDEGSREPGTVTDTSGAGGTSWTIRQRLALTRVEPTTGRTDTLVTATPGTHRYTHYEIDTRAWPEGGVLIVDVSVYPEWEPGTSTGSFDLYPEGVEPTREGYPVEAVASRHDMPPGEWARLVHRFEKGQVFRLSTKGRWGASAGTEHLYQFRAVVAPSDTSFFTLLPIMPDGGKGFYDPGREGITFWAGGGEMTALGGWVAVTVPLPRAHAWADDLERWVARTEREPGACAASPTETVVGLVLEHEGIVSDDDGEPFITAECRLGEEPASGTRARHYEMWIKRNSDRFTRYTQPSAAELRSLAEAIRREAAA